MMHYGEFEMTVRAHNIIYSVACKPIGQEIKSVFSKLRNKTFRSAEQIVDFMT